MLYAVLLDLLPVLLRSSASSALALVARVLKQTTGVRDFPILETIFAHVALNRNASPIFQEKRVTGVLAVVAVGGARDAATSA